MDENLEGPHSSALNYILSSAEDVKDSPRFKDRGRRSQGNAGGLPVKQHGSARRANYKIQKGAVFSGNILSFGCSVCKDHSTYSPNDLLKHFREAHKGILPTYPCDLCAFATNEFAALQRHRIEHKNTLVTCELCCDGIEYSLLLLTRHYIMCHSSNGKFQCDWCEFTTVDAGTFVQHIHHHNESPWKCSKCRHISSNEADHQKHLKSHRSVLPLICQICGYCATTIKQIKGHAGTAHPAAKHPSNQQIHPNVWKTLENGATNSSLDCLNTLENISELQETQKLPRSFGVSGILSNQNGRTKSEMCSEDEAHAFDGTPAKKHGAHRNALTAEQSSPIMLLDNDGCGSPTNPNALTVLMVKNKISLPPNCTTKVMGFKMVDGKKHLVLKVIPVAKQNVCTQDNSLVDLDSPDSRSAFCRSEVLVENGESSASKSSTSPCLDGSESCILNDDILAVNVKVEEEETPVFPLESSPRSDDLGLRGAHCVNGSSTSMVETDPIGRHAFDDKSETVSKMADPSTDHPVSHEASQGKSTWKNHVENCEAVDEGMITYTRNGHIFDVRKENCRKWPETTSQCSQSTPEGTESTRSIHFHDYRHPKKHLANVVPPAEMASSSFFGENAITPQSSFNHQVFAFHNYSKEALGMSPRACHQSEGAPELTAGREINHIPSNFSPASSELSEAFEDDDCVDADEDNPESVLKDFNVIKIEEDLIPVSSNETSTSSALGNFVEQHSDEIITQQLRKERTESLHSNIDSFDCSKQTKSVGRLQERVVLKTHEKNSAMPMQLKPTPSFQLITQCVNPQINVSYTTKSGFETSSRPTSEPVPPLKHPNKAASSDQVTTLSSLQGGLSTSPHRYLLKSSNLKGPVFFSSAPDKVRKTQPTCYLLPRSLPFVQAPSSSGLKLPLNSDGPVLAVPVSLSDESSNLQSGRQTFLLRYISPAKSNVLLNHLETKSIGQSCHRRDKRGNKVVFKIVSPTTSLLKSGSPSSSCQPLLLATSPPTQCFLMPSNKTNACNNVNKITASQNSGQSAVRESMPQSTSKLKPSQADKPQLAPRPSRPPSRRKVRRKVLFDELPETVHKARRFSNQVQTEKDTSVFWSPIAKEVERTLRLAPFNFRQQIKCPRRYQPVVVLNHPDADIPEVANIMKVINRHRGAVVKVALSQKTLKALAELGTQGGGILTEGVVLQNSSPSPRAIQSVVRERFLLKLKLRKKNQKKYEVVEPPSDSSQKTVVFDCWFCGRLFNSQEHWIGHGQRHLMEATRDWNKLL
ncbi:zinc finger protein 518A isoform 1-T2 [Syngnathus typhle]